MRSRQIREQRADALARNPPRIEASDRFTLRWWRRGGSKPLTFSPWMALRPLGDRIHACAESRLRTGIEACAASRALAAVVVGLVAVVGALTLTDSHSTEEHPAEPE